MQRILLGLLSIAGLLGSVPAASAQGSAWQQVGPGIISGVSGVAVVDRAAGRIESLVVRDNKNAGENRLARVTLVRGRVASVVPLAWNGELPGDLESIEAVPGRPSEYLALASRGRLFHFRVGAREATVLKAVQMPAGLPGDDYESFALTTTAGRLIAVWADRGADARLGMIYAADLNPGTLAFGPAVKATFRAPLPAKDLRHLSDIEVTRTGQLIVSSASDPGDDGPFTSAVYVAGSIRVRAGTIRLTVHDKPRELGTYPGRKIEALTCVSPSCGRLLLGTDDENMGGWVRLS